MDFSQIQNNLKRTNAKIKRIQERERRFQSALILSGFIAVISSYGVNNFFHHNPFQLEKREKKQVEYFVSSNENIVYSAYEIIPNSTKIEEINPIIIKKGKWQQNGDKILRNIYYYKFKYQTLEQILLWMNHPNALNFASFFKNEPEYSDYIPQINLEEFTLKYPLEITDIKVQESQLDNTKDILLWMILGSYFFVINKTIAEKMCYGESRKKALNTKRKLLEDKKILEQIYIEQMIQDTESYLLKLKNKNQPQK